MEALITECEIRDVIATLEFYKKLVDTISPLLMKAYAYSFQIKKKLPETCGHAIITVIHKDGKNPTTNVTSCQVSNRLPVPNTICSGGGSNLLSFKLITCHLLLLFQTGWFSTWRVC